MTTHYHHKIRDELYAAFSDVAKPREIYSCDCCHTESDKQLMLKGTQRQVPKKQIYDLEFSWLNTFGDEKDFHYFTPCILDAYLSQSFLLDEDHFYDLMARAGLHSWSSAQQHAVKRAYTAICKQHKVEVPEGINGL